MRDESQIHILPPHSQISEYIALIAAQPEGEMRLGEILVRCGTLTQAEHDAALDDLPVKVDIRSGATTSMLAAIKSMTGKAVKETVQAMKS